MEIIRINDQKLKVTLSAEDMERYELSAEQMDYDNTETRRVLWEILDEAKKRTGFDAAADRTLIQAYPGRRGGCEIYVTLLHPTERASLAGRVGIYPFRDATLLLEVAPRLMASGHSYESALYLDEGGEVFYLIIREPLANSILPRRTLTSLSFLEEYTERLSGVTMLSYIKERARPIIAERAIERLAGAEKIKRERAGSTAE